MDRMITYGIIALVLFLIWMAYLLTRDRNIDKPLSYTAMGED